MDKFPAKGNFDPHRTILVRNFSGMDCDISLRNLFGLFGELEFLHCLETANGKYPNLAVMQYASVTDAKSALHGVLSQTKNHLVLNQPWVGAFSRQDAYTAQQILKGISLMSKIAVQHHCVIHRNKFSLFEFNRFGVVDHYQIQENSSVCEISYVSPLSATLAVLCISNPMMEVTLVKNYINEDGSTDGFTLSRCNFNFSVKSMNPMDITDLNKIIKYQLNKEWNAFLSPITCYNIQEWNKPGVLRCLSISPTNNTLSLRIAVKFEDETSNDIVNDYRNFIVNNENRPMNGQIDPFCKFAVSKEPSLYFLDIFMNFNVFDANRFCKGVFRKKVNLGNTFDMQWYGTPETGYSKWLSIFMLHIGFVNQYNAKEGKCRLEVDSKVQPVNHFFSVLYDDVFPGVEPTVPLATPEKFTSTLQPITQATMKQYSFTTGLNSIPIKLLASTRYFSYFRIPVIASRSFTLNDGKYYY